MDFKDFLQKKILMSFFIATTCISAAMAIIGMLYEPDTHFGYQGLLSPLIYGALTALSHIITYSKYELSVRKTLLRKLFHVAAIEMIVLLIIYINGSLTSLSLAVSVILSVLLVYTTVHLVLWVNDRSTAKAFNMALVEMQRKYEHITRR